MDSSKFVSFLFLELFLFNLFHFFKSCFSFCHTKKEKKRDGDSLGIVKPKTVRAPYRIDMIQLFQLPGSFLFSFN